MQLEKILETFFEIRTLKFLFGKNENSPRLFIDFIELIFGKSL